MIDKDQKEKKKNFIREFVERKEKNFSNKKRLYIIFIALAIYVIFLIYHFCSIIFSKKTPLLDVQSIGTIPQINGVPQQRIKKEENEDKQQNKKENDTDDMDQLREESFKENPSLHPKVDLTN